MKRTALRIGSLLLILVLLLGVLPTAALADGSDIVVSTDATTAEPYFLGDTVTVTATLPQDALEGGSMEITTDADWLSGGSVTVESGEYSRIFTVERIAGDYKTVNFTATYKYGENESSVLTGATSYGFNLRNTLTVTVTKNGKPLPDATVVLHHQYDVEKNITLNHTSNGVYVTAPWALSVDDYDYVTVSADGLETVTLGGENLASEIKAGGEITSLTYNYVTEQPVETYQVTFDSMGGSAVNAVTVQAGGTITEPTAPVRSGYTFDGWYTYDGTRFDFRTSIRSSFTLYAHWVANPEAHYLVNADFPSRVAVGTYRDASVSLSGVLGVSIYSGARLEVSVSKPSHAEAQLWYDLDSSWWWDYVDVAERGYLFRNTEIDEMTLMNFPLSLYVDKAGSYTFTFTLYDGNGVALASDSATVRAYPAEEDYRVYIDAGKHGTVTVSDRYAAKGDRVIIYATPDKGYELDTLKVYDAWGDRVDVYAYGNNYAFNMPRSAVKVVATFTDAKYGHFTDVPKDSWYYDAVYYVYNHDIMDGIGNRTFNPYGDLSRAMIVTTLYRLEGEPGVRTSGSFRDVPDNTWYSSAVEWAAKEGIVKGYGKKTFKPSESVTVEQLAAILQRYADYKGYDIDETVRLYADAVVSQWAVNNVRWAAAEGLLRDGRSTNGTLVATRAEIAYALYGFMVNVAK